MKIENVKIYDLKESILASGYPMRTVLEDREIEDKDINRCHNLSFATTTLEGNNAHD